MKLESGTSRLQRLQHQHTLHQLAHGCVFELFEPALCSAADPGGGKESQRIPEAQVIGLGHGQARVQHIEGGDAQSVAGGGATRKCHNQRPFFSLSTLPSHTRERAEQHHTLGTRPQTRQP